MGTSTANSWSCQSDFLKQRNSLIGSNCFVKVNFSDEKFQGFYVLGGAISCAHSPRSYRCAGVVSNCTLFWTCHIKIILKRRFPQFSAVRSPQDSHIMKKISSVQNFVIMLKKYNKNIDESFKTFRSVTSLKFWEIRKLL